MYFYSVYTPLYNLGVVKVMVYPSHMHLFKMWIVNTNKP